MSQIAPFDLASTNILNTQEDEMHASLIVAKSAQFKLARQKMKIWCLNIFRKEVLNPDVRLVGSPRLKHEMSDLL